MVEPPQAGSERLPWLDTHTQSNVPVNLNASAASRWTVRLLVAALIAAAAFMEGRRSIDPPSVAQLPIAPGATNSFAASHSVRTVLPTIATIEPQKVRAAAGEPLVRLAPARRVPHFERANHSSRSAYRTGRRHRGGQAAIVRKHRSQRRVGVHHWARTRRFMAARRLAYGQRIGRQPFVAAPSLGRTVQLGSFPNVGQARWAARVFRYRYQGLLAQLPQRLMLVRLNGSQRSYYKVQFFPPNELYAKVTCQRIRRAGKGCIVE